MDTKSKQSLDNTRRKEADDHSDDDSDVYYDCNSFNDCTNNFKDCVINFNGLNVDFNNCKNEFVDCDINFNNSDDYSDDSEDSDSEDRCSEHYHKAFVCQPFKCHIVKEEKTKAFKPPLPEAQWKEVTKMASAVGELMNVMEYRDLLDSDFVEAIDVAANFYEGMAEDIVCPERSEAFVREVQSASLDLKKKLKSLFLRELDKKKKSLLDAVFPEQLPAEFKFIRSAVMMQLNGRESCLRPVVKKVLKDVRSKNRSSYEKSFETKGSPKTSAETVSEEAAAKV